MVGLLRAQTWPGVVWLGGTTATEGGGRAPARRCAGLELTELEQRALEDAVGCWGGGGAVAVVLEWPGTSWRGYGDGGAARARRLRLRELRTAKEEREMKLRALGVAGGCWREEGALRPGLAALGRAPATRGHASRHAATTA